MKFTKYLVTLGLLGSVTLAPIGADAYNVEQDPINFTYHPGYATNEIIVLHEAGNPSNVGPDSLDREVSYMKRNWTSAYVSYFVGSGGRVKQLAPEGYYQYGAGQIANSKAFAQIELARTNDATTFKKDYAAYVNLTRDLADKIGATYDLDDATGYGIKTHNWVTDNWWGDHRDPYSYLASWGISKAQFAKDLQTGLPEDGTSNTAPAPKPTPTPAPKPTPSAPQIQPASGTFTMAGRLPVSADLDPSSPEAAYYVAGQSFYYDGYVQANGYVWLTYINYGGTRSYVAIGPDDGNPATTWGWGFQV